MPFDLSSYISLGYLLAFLPMTIVLYMITPQRFRWITLLAASYLMFWTISEGLILYLLGSTLLIYLLGRFLSFLQAERDSLIAFGGKKDRSYFKARYKKLQRGVLAVGILAHVAALAILKYSGFFALNINRLSEAMGWNLSVEIPSFILPIGISFYSLQAISYLLDVYRETIHADKNIGRVALFLAFFPEIIEGPICRYSDTAYQLTEGASVSYKNFVSGLQRIGFGLMKKMIVADRLNVFIKTVFGNWTQYDGGILFVAGIAYTVQLYMEFSGTMDVVVGSAEIFGIRMPENFKRPFFSKSVSEFWKRWHITLGTWFKDYIFYPITMSHRMKKLTSFGRKHLGNHYGPLLADAIALLAVWVLNGLWHGAGWTFLAFGLYHFAMILTGNILEPPSKKLTDVLHINRKGWFFENLQMLRTAIFVVFGAYGFGYVPIDPIYANF